MAFTTYADYAAWYGTNPSPPGTSLQYTEMIDEVTQAIKDHCKQNLEAASYSNVVLNAPASGQLVLKQKPVRNDANLTIYANPTAFGNVSAFTSNTLLTAGVNYYLNTNDDDSGNSTSGVVTMLTQPWSQSWAIPYGQLAYKWVPTPGALLVSYRGGYETLPKSIVEATNLAVSLLYQRRVMGLQVASESRGAWSISFSGPATATAIIDSPDISSLLMPYCAIERMIGWGVG